MRSDSLFLSDSSHGRLVMRRVVLAAMLLAPSVAAPTAQDALTTNQRDTDFVQLASMFAKNYAPYEWKRDVIGFDLYRLTPWLQRVHQLRGVAQRCACGHLVSVEFFGFASFHRRHLRRRSSHRFSEQSVVTRCAIPV